MAEDHHVQASEYDIQGILHPIMSTHRRAHSHNGIESLAFPRSISGDAQNIIVPAHQTNNHGKYDTSDWMILSWVQVSI